MSLWSVLTDITNDPSNGTPGPSGGQAGLGAGHLHVLTYLMFYSLQTFYILILFFLYSRLRLYKPKINRPSIGPMSPIF